MSQGNTHPGGQAAAPNQTGRPRGDQTVPHQTGNLPPVVSGITAQAVSGITNEPTAPLPSALARLAASRQRLRHEMLPPAPADDSAAGGSLLSGGALAQRVRRWWRRSRRSAAAAPLVGVAMDGLQAWWQRQPLRPVGEVVVAEVRQVALPLLRRHPLWAVALAAAAGAALVAGRPWRWALVANQVKPMPQRLGRWVAAQLSQPTTQAALVSLLMMVAGRSAQREHEPADSADRPDRAAAAAAAYAETTAAHQARPAAANNRRNTASATASP